MKPLQQHRNRAIFNITPRSSKLLIWKGKDNNNKRETIDYTANYNAFFLVK